MPPAVQTTVSPARVAAATRLLSLDAFRGLTMAAMVIVNNPGDWSAMYWPLEHAEWNGWTPTDLIYPFFLFIVGVSMTLSKQTTAGPWWRVAKRALLLVTFGLLLTGFPRFSPSRWRFTGILPRIAFCYFFAAIAYRWTAARDSGSNAARRSVRAQALILSAVTAVILFGYWYLLARVPAPGGTAGDLTPDGNIGAYYDRLIFGSHLYRQARWDPEGLLSSVPGIATTLLGVLAGMWLQQPGEPRRKVMPLAAAGVVLFVVGQAWHVVLPINKQLWTSSYVLLTAGAGAMLLAACIELIDIRGWRRSGQPFVVFGSNAIALFVVSGLIGKAIIIWHLPGQGGKPVIIQSWIYHYGFAWMASPKNASLLYSLAFLVMMYAMCDFLYRRRLFLKV